MAEERAEALELEASRWMTAAMAALDVLHVASGDGDVATATAGADAAAAHLQAAHRATTRLALFVDGDTLTPESARAHRRDVEALRTQYFDVRGVCGGC